MNISNFTGHFPDRQLKIVPFVRDETKTRTSKKLCPRVSPYYSKFAWNTRDTESCSTAFVRSNDHVEQKYRWIGFVAFCLAETRAPLWHEAAGVCIFHYSTQQIQKGRRNRTLFPSRFLFSMIIRPRKSPRSAVSFTEITYSKWGLCLEQRSSIDSSVSFHCLFTPLSPFSPSSYFEYALGQSFISFDRKVYYGVGKRW